MTTKTVDRENSTQTKPEQFCRAHLSMLCILQIVAWILEIGGNVHNSHTITDLKC